MSQPPAPIPGQPAELEELFEEHHASVLRAAYRITGNATDAEDVLQTVFMRLLRRPADAPGMENAAAYLHRAAVNAALDLVRDRQPAKNQPLEAHMSHLVEGAAAAPDRQQEASEMRAFVRRAIRRLPPRAAEIFALHYFENYSNQQIASMLDLSPSGVAVTLHRTRARLQEEVRNFMGEVS
ncbi:MAG: sigma-70 family RNA polymerase sigma factor [Acidobacteriia bacterium]|nr:sigma-70 family RNA polymerase sigma factor [Terriglobia bacterium]